MISFPGREESPRVVLEPLEISGGQAFAQELVQAAVVGESGVK